MEAPEPESGQEVDPEALEEALETLARLHPRHAEVVRLRFFEGLTGEQTGLALGVSPRTVDGDWKMARAWLRGHLDYGCAE